MSDTILPFRRVFNYLPRTVIMPHYDEFGDSWGPALRMLMGDLTILGIDGFTALVCHDGKHTVAGAGGVTVWSKMRKVRHIDGETVTWP
ncbi:MAG TPA: hypothetical protein VJL59_24560 [Anaerolineales bacterium]|nr:hypothetical protein [Anaerolineales bacterium]